MSEPSAADATQISLHVMAILDDAPTAELMARALAQSGDQLSVATDLAEGLARAAAEAPDVAFVDVALGRNAGLAVVHHLRAVAPSVSVYALARPTALELGTQAVALGGAGLLMLPLSGDELLTSLAAVRERRAEREARLRLERAQSRNLRGASLVTRVAEIAEAKNRRDAAERLVAVLVSEADARDVLVYLPAAEGSRQLMRAASHGEHSDAPTFCDEMAALNFARERGLEVVRLALRVEHSGLLLIGLPGQDDEDGPLPLVGLVAAQAATAFALIGEREHSTRGAMKDPTTSAYTFAYFVDVAGREIDKARRHERRFALATINMELAAASAPPSQIATPQRLPGGAAAPTSDVPAPESRAGDSARPSRRPSYLPSSAREPSVQAAERVLDAVRDTDVLARVDDHEFYLLMPETGGTGAHTCRRRVLRKLSGPGGIRKLDGALGYDVTMGVATFPHDGVDLSQLLRVAKHRADQSRRSVVRKFALERLPLGEILDTLLWSAGESLEGIEAPRVIELPAMDLVGLAVASLGEARRGGKTRVVCTLRPGVSVGAAARAAMGRESDDVQFDAVDITGVPGCRDLEVLAIVAEHAAYVLLGRVDRGVVRAAHAADALLVDLVTQRLGDLAGVRLLE